MQNDGLLDDLAPKKKAKRQTVKKFHSTKGVPLDVTLRRQVAAELGEDEPTDKNKRYILLQKYGVVTPKIDRLVTKPAFMSEAEWKRKSNEWYQATKGMIQPQQQRREGRYAAGEKFKPRHRTGMRPNLPRQGQVSLPLQERMGTISASSSRQSKQASFGTIRHNAEAKNQTFARPERFVRRMPEANSKVGD